MSLYAYHLAQAAGLNPMECKVIGTASLLHDVGKIGIPDRILQKPGKLTPEEWKIMMTHTTIGSELLSGSNSKFLKLGEEIALTHHEKWDGSGYPKGLKKEKIPLAGRICGLCDVLDALTSKRPYKKAWPLEDALREIKKGRGSHFDPRLVDCFFKILPRIHHIHEEYGDPQE